MIAFATLETPALRPAPLGEMFRRDPLFAGAAAILALAMVPTLLAWAIDARLVGGVAVWSKPLKFLAALTVYLGTLAWFTRWLPPGFVARRGYRIFARVVVVAVALEMAWLVGAAAAGVPSHFNVATPTMAAIYSAMGVFAVLLTSAAMVQGVVILRARDAGGDPALRLAIGLGLVLTFALTLPVAGYLSGTTGHLVGVEAAGARRLALFGWARDGGDLRVAHFLATHAMHALPIAGWIAGRMLAPARARAAILAAAAGYAALVVGTFLQALVGRPFLPWLG
jgi:hypothetical protein